MFDFLELVCCIFSGDLVLCGLFWVLRLRWFLIIVTVVLCFCLGVLNSCLIPVFWAWCFALRVERFGVWFCGFICLWFGVVWCDLWLRG